MAQFSRNQASNITTPGVHPGRSHFLHFSNSSHPATPLTPSLLYTTAADIRTALATRPASFLREFTLPDCTWELQSHSICRENEAYRKQSLLPCQITRKYLELGLHPKNLQQRSLLSPTSHCLSVWSPTAHMLARTRPRRLSWHPPAQPCLHLSSPLRNQPCYAMCNGSHFTLSPAIASILKLH